MLDDTTPDKSGHATPNPTLDSLIERADAAGRWSLPWADPRRAPPGSERGSVRWGLIKPAPGSRCTLP